MDRLFCPLLAACAFTIAPAYADYDLFAGIGSQEMTLLEHSDATGKQLVREHGWIPGISYGLSRSFDIWRLGAQVQQSYGTIPYDGQTQAGMPHQTETTHFISQLQLSAGFMLHPDSELYTGLNLHQIVRDVANRDNVYGATETYDEVLVRFGLKQTLFARRQQQLQVWAEWQKSVRAHSSIDSRVDDDFDLTLSHGTAWAFGLHYQHPLSQQLSWFVDGSCLHHRYQDSTIANNYYQPPISLRHVNVYGGLQWHFD